VNPFFDIGYRLVALAVCFWCGRRVWRGYVERKYTLINSDLLDWWTPSQVFHRDVAPVRYWMFACMEAGSAVICLAAAVIGYWQPNT
jgi:hypothetical protein